MPERLLYVYLLKAEDGRLIGAFSSGLAARAFATDHRMLWGWYVEQTRIDGPTVMLKDGTY